MTASITAEQLQVITQILSGNTSVSRANDLTLATGNTAGFMVQWGNIFPLCSSADVAPLYYQANEPLLEWIGFRKATSYRVQENFLSYTAPAGYTVGTAGRGIPTSLCEPGTGYEYRFCDFVLEGFGFTQLSAPVRKNGGNEIPLCITQPRYTIAGERINNQDDWDIAMLTNVVMQDAAVGFLIGNKTTTYDADGIRRLVKTGYTSSNGVACPLMDSTIINWGGGAVCGSAAEDFAENTPTINGVAFDFDDPKFLNLYFILREVYYRNRERARLAQKPNPVYGDVAIALPAHAIQCLIDCAVCWVECAGDYTRMTTEAATNARRRMMNGNGVFSEIDFDGFRVPLIPYNPIGTGAANSAVRGLMDNSDGTWDMFMLWRGFGNDRSLYMEYNDLSDAVGDTYETNENGQLLMWQTLDHRCLQTSMGLEWRVYMNAPWLQTRVQNVSCERLYNRDVFPFNTYASSAPADLYTR